MAIQMVPSGQCVQARALGQHGKEINRIAVPFNGTDCRCKNSPTLCRAIIATGPGGGQSGAARSGVKLQKASSGIQSPVDPTTSMDELTSILETCCGETCHGRPAHGHSLTNFPKSTKSGNRRRGSGNQTRPTGYIMAGWEGRSRTRFLTKGLRLDLLKYAAAWYVWLTDDFGADFRWP